MDYCFDRRSFTNSYSYQWQNGRCNVKFLCNSSATDGISGRLSCYTVDLEAANCCNVLLSPRTLVGLRPGRSTNGHWPEDLPATAETPADILAFVESSNSWLHLRDRLLQCLDMPAEGLESIQLQLLPWMQDAIWKARFLEHCTLSISVVVNLTTELVCQNEEDLQRESSRGFIVPPDVDSVEVRDSYMDYLQMLDDMIADDSEFLEWYEFPTNFGASKKVIEKYLRVEQVHRSEEDPEDEGLANELCTICISRIWEDPDDYQPASGFASSPNTGEEAGVAGTLPCGHAFHRRCITQWLEIRGICPLCRTELPELEEDEEEWKF